MSTQHCESWRPYPQPHEVNYRSMPDTISYSSTTRSLPSPTQWATQSSAHQQAVKPSLPSISNLLVIADRDRSDRYSHGYSRSLSPQQTRLSPRLSHAPKYERSRHSAHPSDSSVYPPVAGTPPLPASRHDSAQDGVPSSPSTVSSSSTTSGPPYFVGSSINNLDAHEQHGADSHFSKRSPRPLHAETSPYSPSYAGSPYATSPGTVSTRSFPSQSSPAFGEHFQPLRSLPPQQQHAQPMPLDGSKLPPMNPWEHHHYISPAASAGYPSTQDRYQCMTCKKAFSRPSSLKIHSHSHTGEKPFRCAQSGCNKSFSVRSNMKRHERGCHSGGGGSLVTSM